ncbi:MAG: sodium:solute symporter family protein [Planctomycetes bacterium]|nr:sodium:solute symporter family protein [Planctomycetota bacterium]
MTAFWIIVGYLAVLIFLGIASNRVFRGTAVDFFLASRGVGPFMLLMSLFGTTMTAFAMVGSSGESFDTGIGVYGMMASWSGIVHSLCFFLVGVKLWSFGKRYGYMTQIQFFRDRLESSRIGLLLFPVLVGMMIPYLLVGVLGLGTAMGAFTTGAFPNAFPTNNPATNGSLPPWLGMGIICAVVLLYVFVGGVRSTVWVNAFQNALFMTVGIVTMFVIADRLGGAQNATRMVAERYPSMLKRSFDPKDEPRYQQKLAAFEKQMAEWEQRGRTGPKPHHVERPGVGQWEFLTYAFIPLSVAMFPHLFQYYLTAKSAKSFRLSVIMHPVCILVIWLPCVMLGVWATSAMVDGKPVIPPSFTNPNAVLAKMVKDLTGPILGGLTAAGILATNSLDAQFLCLGNMFTNDIVVHHYGEKRFTDRQLVVLGRVFVVAVVVVAYVIALLQPRGVFELGVWCFSGFASLAPLVIGALYWKRMSKAGAYASVFATAVTWFWLFHESGYGAEQHYLVWGMNPVAVIITVGTLALVLVSLVTPPPSPATLAKFFGGSGGSEVPRAL